MQVSIQVQLNVSIFINEKSILWKHASMILYRFAGFSFEEDKFLRHTYILSFVSDLWRHFPNFCIFSSVWKAEKRARFYTASVRTFMRDK